MPLIRTPATAKGRLVRHVLAYNAARLALVAVAAGVIVVVDALTGLDLPVVLVLHIARATSLPLSAFALRQLRRTINADIEAVDRERSATRSAPRSAPAPRRNTDKRA